MEAKPILIGIAIERSTDESDYQLPSRWPKLRALAIESLPDTAPSGSVVIIEDTPSWES